MRERHLRLVSSHCDVKEKEVLFIKYLELISDFFDKIFTSKQEKIYIIKDFLIKLYQDYEISTGIDDPPYYIRAEKRIIKIIKEKKVNYYYNRFKRFKNINFD